MKITFVPPKLLADITKFWWGCYNETGALVQNGSVNAKGPYEFDIETHNVRSLTIELRSCARVDNVELVSPPLHFLIDLSKFDGMDESVHIPKPLSMKVSE